MATGLWVETPVDTTRDHFEVVHSLFKQTAARFGHAPGSARLALQFLLPADPQAEMCRREIVSDLETKLAGCADALQAFERLAQGCCSPNNLYTSIHWCLMTEEMQRETQDSYHQDTRTRSDQRKRE